MKILNNKILKISVLSAFILSVLISMVSFDANCNELKNNVFRLHIIANSDSEADQLLKLKVRDAVLEAGGKEFENCQNINDAINNAENNIEFFKKTAQDVVVNNGYDYKVDVCVEKTYFNTRVYDEFALPAGEYYALCIKIGKAEGKNWWCVMFPALCVPTATNAKLENSVGDSAVNIANNHKKYIFRFKTIEIFEQIKKNIKIK